MGSRVTKIFLSSFATAALAAGVVFLVHDSSARPNKPCNNMSDACLIEVANTYMDAQAGGPGTCEAMRLAPSAHRWENAINNATTGDQIRSASPCGANLDIWSQRDRDRLWVDGNDVISIWIVDIRDADTGEHTNTAHIFERIRVEGGAVCGDGLSPCVTEVEAIFCNTPVGLEPALPDPVEPRPSALCFRSDFF
jgi:hypothetical protein